MVSSEKCSMARPGAPNVVVILIDDMGFGASSPFGGPIDMPTAERLAGGGLRFNQFHTTALCSPTRASLMTGRNPHSVGFGTVTNFVSSDPGYNCIRPENAGTIAQILRESGYSTAAFGKWHQTPGAETGPDGPFDRWPTGEGFEHFYGFLGGSTDQYYPALYDGVTPVDCPATPEDGYHLSEDLSDKVIDWIECHHADTSDKPFFAYLALGATHSPLQVPKRWRDKYAGQFDHGWNRQREITLARQKELGIIPPDGEMTPWPDLVPDWGNISEDDQRAAALLMELYAGFAEHTDAQIGRIVDALSEMEILDNTLICYLLGDNGASAEGGMTGTVNEGILFNGLGDSSSHILQRADELGGPTTAPQYPFGWALAMDTPYQWVKQVASHYGGTRNPLIVHWPDGIESSGEVRTQWHFVSDIAPTILEAAGIEQPREMNGAEQQPMDGVAMGYCFDNAKVASRRTTQYFEVFGNRGIYHEGWVACTLHRVPMQAASADKPFEDDKWELYDSTSDWTQAHDVAETHPRKLEELQRLFQEVAAANQVLLDNNRMQRMREGAINLSLSAEVKYPGSMPPLLPDAAVRVLNRSHIISVNVTLDSTGSTGVLVSQGARADGGWGIYLRQGRVAYCHSVADLSVWHVRSDYIVQPGTREICMKFDYDGGGLGKGATVRLAVDGVEVTSGRVENSTAFYVGGTGLLTIGRGHGVPLSDDYQRDDRIAGVVDSVHFRLHGELLEDEAAVVRNALAIQ
ncbi:Arylsulfatase [Rhodococcus erythropolis]|uniref:arylsulfatase n=1 Tax=Rhodococcus erythropolis TaxID=1833 RepID=UPI000BB2D242|nr:arylsulfatase [Rhodococcus erythropolis]PBI88817.1 Arylsulfatase [Rhodococcus erythropolis]